MPARELFYNLYDMKPTPVGDLEFIVLVTVARLGDGAYGMAIRQDVSARTGRPYSVGAIYASLQRLEGKGLLRSWESDPLPVRGGRARRYFALTTAGRANLRRVTEEKRRLWTSLALVGRRA